MRIDTCGRRHDIDTWAKYCAIGRAAIADERDELDDLRARDGLSSEAFDELQEALDWREMSLLPEEDRRMEEN